MAKDINELYVENFLGRDNDFRNYMDGLISMSLDVIEILINSLEITGTIHESILPITEKIATKGPVAKEEYIDKLLLKLKSLGYKINKTVIKQAISKLAKQTTFDSEIIEDNLESISPAIDFLEETGYISVPLDVKIKNKKEGTENIEIVTIPHIITSEKQLIVVNGNYIENSGHLIHLKSVPMFIEKTRWKYSDIKSYLKSNEKQDIVDTFQECTQIYEKYLDFRQPFTSEILSIWTIGSYLYKIFDAFPYLFFTGQWGSGKSKILEILSHLCFNSTSSSNMSPSVLFRIIETSGGSLFLDETELLKDPKVSQDFRLLLNAGYKKGGMVHRSKPDTFEPQSFAVYSPKAIANIKGLEPVLESRCITIIMLRTKDKEISKKSVSSKSENWFYIRDKLYRTGLDHFKEIKKIYFEEQKSVDFIWGRAAELWLPILSIAKFIDQSISGVYQVVKDFCLEKIKEQDYETDVWTEAVIRTTKYLISTGLSPFRTKTIKENITNYLDSDPDDRLPSPQWIGHCLKRLGLAEAGKNKVKRRGAVYYKITKEEVEDVMERLGLQEEKEI